MVKVCRICGAELPVSDFAHDAHQRDGLDLTCRYCRANFNDSTPADARRAGTPFKRRIGPYMRMAETLGEVETALRGEPAPKNGRIPAALDMIDAARRRYHLTRP